MATTYKSFLSNDITNTRTLLHEAIPITGSIVSGTYNNTNALALGSENNIKTYGHGMFESVYDYPYLSSSANHIFDITCGYASTSDLSASANTQNDKKINIYNQMAQYLNGYDHTGSIKNFKLPSTGLEMEECYFVPFSRLLTKDEVKKGTFTMELGTLSAYDSVGSLFGSRIKLTDSSGSTGYSVDSPAGEYGELFPSSSVTPAAASATITMTDFNEVGTGNTITVVTTAGSTVTITGHGSTTSMADATGDSSNGLFASVTNNNTTATNIKTAFNTHDELTATVADAVVTITQNRTGASGNTAITLVDPGTDGMTKTDFAAGAGATAGLGGNGAAVNGEVLGNADTLPACGLLYYQAGIAVVSGSVFSDSDDGGILSGSNGSTVLGPTSTDDGFNFITGSTIAVTADAVRTRMYNMSYNNTTELNSTIYFCRANHNDFNYSSNPTYLSGSKLRVKTRAADAPVTYITTVGLYSADNELLAVAKLSEPLRKDPTNELTLRVRLDY
mgnify:CR=1 FL=1|jgi:hypothetical protein